MNNTIAKEMKALLYHFWITKDENPDLYYQIKYNQNKLKDFISKNLGSNFIIHDRFIKLEKVPTVIKENGKIGKFTNVFDYVILMLLLMFLEDKTRGDKFILSDLVEYIKNTAITLELDHVPDWNKVSDRRSFINAIDFLKELSVIRIRDEEKLNFAENMNAEALYEATGISNYVMRMFDGEINDFKTPEDFIKSEFLSQEEEKGDVRRYRVFRNILYTPATFMKNIPSSDVDYIKKNRIYIRNEIDKNLDMQVEITHNMALLFDDISSLEKDNFPNTKKITEIVLMVNAKILEDIAAQKLALDEYEAVTIKESYLESVILGIRVEKEPYIGKTFGKLTDDKFYKEILEYMKKYNFVEKIGDEVILYPTIGRMIGKTYEVKADNAEQISLFGGNNEL